MPSPARCSCAGIPEHSAGLGDSGEGLLCGWERGRAAAQGGLDGVGVNLDERQGEERALGLWDQQHHRSSLWEPWARRLCRPGQGWAPGLAVAVPGTRSPPSPLAGLPNPRTGSHPVRSTQETGSLQSFWSEVCASEEFPAQLFLEALQKCGSLGDSAAASALGERRQPRGLGSISSPGTAVPAGPVLWVTLGHGSVVAGFPNLRGIGDWLQVGAPVVQERGQGGIGVPCSSPFPLLPQRRVCSEVSWPLGSELLELLLPVHSRECPRPAQDTLFLMFSLEAGGVGRSV